MEHPPKTRKDQYEDEIRQSRLSQMSNKQSKNESPGKNRELNLENLDRYLEKSHSQDLIKSQPIDLNTSHANNSNLNKSQTEDLNKSNASNLNKSQTDVRKSRATNYNKLHHTNLNKSMTQINEEDPAQIQNAQGAAQ